MTKSRTSLSLNLECPTSERLNMNIANNPLLTKPNAFAPRATHTHKRHANAVLFVLLQVDTARREVSQGTQFALRISPATTAVASTLHVTVNQVTSNLYAKQPTRSTLKAYESDWLLRAQKDSVSYLE